MNAEQSRRNSRNGCSNPCNSTFPPWMCSCFTVLVHGEVSDDDGRGVGWRNEGHTRGGGVPTGHGHRVSRWDTERAGGGNILALPLPLPLSSHTLNR